VRQLARTAALAASVAAVAIAGSLATSALLGMGASETAHIAASLAPAAAATVLAAVAAPRLLSKASASTRMVAAAVVAIVVALANLAALALNMVVEGHDAKALLILLVYALGAGLTVALALARASAPALARVGRTVAALGEGKLSARVGELDAGPEMDSLARTLDDMADRLERIREREHAVETMRKDLITAVSHDLRTPLASLRAMVEAVYDGVVADPSSLRRYAVEMRNSVGQLSVMVDDLFELSQIEAGAIEVERRRVRLDEIVRLVVTAVEPHAANKGLALRTDLGGAADAPCSPRMTRVFQNLLMNAVRHTPADGSVSVLAKRAGNRIEVAVEDSGDGLAHADLERVFEPFYRGDPARSGPGAGLGLALAKRIVEGVGGRISAETKAEGGARFSVLLPVG
jgi:signal transduction histidine kinase